MKTIEVKLLSDSAIMPTQGSPGSAGWDLYADETITILPTDRAMIATGIAVALPPDSVGMIWPRSGMAWKKGVDTLAGVVDSDYRGHVGVVLQNHDHNIVYIKPGDRIAQLVVQPIVPARVMAVRELGKTHRGDQGFGSTGA